MDFLKSVCWLYLAHPHQPIHIHKHGHIHTRSRLRRTNHSQSLLCPYHTCDIIDYWAYEGSRYTGGRIYALCTKCGNTGAWRGMHESLPSIQWNGWVEHTSRTRIGCTAFGKFENSHLPFANTNRQWRTWRSVYIHSRQHGFAANYRCRMCADMRTQGNHSADWEGYPVLLDARRSKWLWERARGKVQQYNKRAHTHTHTETLWSSIPIVPSSVCEVWMERHSGHQNTEFQSFDFCLSQGGANGTIAVSHFKCVLRAAQILGGVRDKLTKGNGWYIQPKGINCNSSCHRFPDCSLEKGENIFRLIYMHHRCSWELEMRRENTFLIYRSKSVKSHWTQTAIVTHWNFFGMHVTGDARRIRRCILAGAIPN